MNQPANNETTGAPAASGKVDLDVPVSPELRLDVNEAIARATTLAAEMERFANDATVLTAACTAACGIDATTTGSLLRAGRVDFAAFNRRVMQQNKAWQEFRRAVAAVATSLEPLAGSTRSSIDACRVVLTDLTQLAAAVATNAREGE